MLSTVSFDTRATPTCLHLNLNFALSVRYSSCLQTVLHQSRNSALLSPSAESNEVVPVEWRVGHGRYGCAGRSGQPPCAIIFATPAIAIFSRIKASFQCHHIAACTDNSIRYLGLRLACSPVSSLRVSRPLVTDCQLLSRDASAPDQGDEYPTSKNGLITITDKRCRCFGLY